MSVRSRRLLVLPVAAVAVAFVAVPGGSGTATQASAPRASSSEAIKSADFWAAHPEQEGHLALENEIYEAPNDQRFLQLIDQANGLPRYTSKTWKSRGPVNGIVSDPDIGSGAQLFGPVGGIGTALAADPSDATGNTIYLGTFGGLWKSTNGGQTLTNLSDGIFARAPIGAIAVDPQNPDTIYVGTGVSQFTVSDDAVGVGMYVSHDGGASFVRPTVNTRGYGINAISVHPTTGTVLVGTNFGLWRSTNNGGSFHKVALPTNAAHNGEATHSLGSWVGSIVRKPGAPNQVTLAVGYFRGKAPLPDDDVIGTGNGLYRSNNDGAPGSFNYMASTSGLASSPTASSDPIGFTVLAYGTAPGEEDTLWALVHDAGRSAGETLFDTPALPISLSGASLLNGVYRSPNDGAAWRLAATPQTLTTALACTTCLAAYPLSYAAGAQAHYNNWIATDPVNPDRIYVGLEEAFQGDVALIGPLGQQPVVKWQAMQRYANLCGFVLYPGTIPGQNSVPCPQQAPFYGGGSTHPDQQSVAVVKTGDGVRMYAGNDGGWWKQDQHTVLGSIGPAFDNESWTSLNKPATVLPWNVDFLQNGDIIMALQDNGTIHVKKDGSAYNVCGGDGVFALPGVNSNSYYCGVPGHFLLATKDDFRHTILASPGTAGATFLSPIASDLTDGNHLIAGASEIRETTDGADSNTYDPTNTLQLTSTWATVFTPPPPPETAVPAWDTSALAVVGPVAYNAFCNECRPSLSAGSAIVDPEAVHARIATNVRTDCKPAKKSGACWHMTASKGLPHEQVSGIVIDPDDARTIYVSLRQYIVLGANHAKTGAEKVMVSHDAGESFTDISGDLPRTDAHSIVLRDGRLVVATDVGIFTSKAESKKWARTGQGLPAVPYRNMKIDRTGRFLIAGAYGRGAYTFDFGSAANKPPTTIPRLPRSEPPLATTGGNVLWPSAAVALLAVALLLIRRRRLAR